MSIPLDPRLDWEVIAQPELGFCRVTLAGVMTVDNAKIVLEDLWKHTLYLDQPAALWDVSQCDLPNFDALSEISAYIKKRKARARSRGACIRVPCFRDLSSGTGVPRLSTPGQSQPEFLW